MGSEKGKRPEYRIDFLKSASAELARVPPALLRDVANAIENLKHDPEPLGHIALKGYDPAIRRITVGGYRIIYEIKEKFLLVLVLKVAERSRVYAEFARLIGRVPPARRRR